jgi:aryl-alcohol dehydrogenase-like predicted oxidoreductase
MSTSFIDPIPSVDLEETLAAADELRAAGKIRHFGTSTFPPELLVEAQWAAERGGWARPATEQPPYSLLVRIAEAGVLPTSERHDLGVLCWGALNGGWLAGGYRLGRELPSSSRQSRLPWRYDLSLPANRRKLEAADALADLADAAGLPLVHLALAFVLEHPAVASAIIGPRTLQHLEMQLGAAECRLSKDVLDAIDEIVQPGSLIQPLDLAYTAPAVADAALRRR